jgi:autotransporter family porin
VLTHSSGVAAAGGNGVDLAGGALNNTGTITGGAGGYGVYQGGAGGIGVYVNGGTMITSGTISGGAGGHGGTINGADGVAVKFGAADSTLVIDAGARFNGAIVANSAANDTLVLAGNVDGLLSGFGTSVTGFTSIDEAAHAHWTLNGTIDGVSVLAIGSGATLDLNGAVRAGAIAFGTGGGETLKLESAAQVSTVLKGFGAGDVIDLAKLQVSSMSFLHGTLTMMDGGNVVDTLRFGGAYTAADFIIHADGAGGTDIGFAQEPAWHGHGAWAAEQLRWDIFSWLHH